MNQERAIAGSLVLCCALAAAGSWFARRPAVPDGGNRHRDAAIGSGFFGGAAGVAQLDVQGMIVDSGSGGGLGAGSQTSSHALLKAIDKVREDGASVVLLNINSPGGTASASQAVYDELVRLKAEKHVKVVAAMGDLAASGAYYIASAADEIVANPASLTGSIGVIMHMQNLQGLMGKLGVANGVIKSGPHKDLASPFRPLDAAERQILQGIVDDTYAQFLQAVADGRHLPLPRVRPLADGRIFTGRQALRQHLVDKLGNFEVAKAEARRLGHLAADARIKGYSEDGWRDYVHGLFSATGLAPLGGFLGAGHTLVQAGAFDRVPLLMYD